MAKQRRRQLSSSSNKVPSSSSSSSSTATTTTNINPTSNAAAAANANRNAQMEAQLQCKKALITKKLFDPCTVLRYESLSMHYKNEDERNDCDESNSTEGNYVQKKENSEDHHEPNSSNSSPLNKVIGSSTSLRLNPMEAMELSHIPWKIKILMNDNVKNNNTLSSSSSQQETFSKSQHESYPPYNYLSIRHEQNMNLVQSLFEKGVSYAKQGLQMMQKQQDPQHHHLHNISKSSSSSLSSPSSSYQNLLQNAENCYKQGLDLIPNHIGILTAYSALCINDNRLVKAKNMLQKVMMKKKRSESNKGKKDEEVYDKYEVNYGGDDVLQGIYKDAILYMTVVERKLLEEEHQQHQQTNTQIERHYVNSTSKTRQKTTQLQLSNKVNDLITERSFMMMDGDDDNECHGDSSLNGRGIGGVKKKCNLSMKKYELLSSSSSSEDDEEQDDYNSSSRSSSIDSSNGHSDSEDSDDKKRRRKHKRSSSSGRRRKSHRRKSISKSDRKKSRKRSRKSLRNSIGNDDNEGNCGRDGDVNVVVNKDVINISGNSNDDDRKASKKGKRKKRKQDEEKKRKRKKHRRRSHDS